MTVETAAAIGMAVAHLFRHGGASPRPKGRGAPPRSQGRTRRGRIVIGKDTRLSGYMFETAIAAGICSMGADVWLCGPLPTPGIAHLTASMRADAGVVISASHNPFQDNGIKIFAADGFKLPDAREHAIERLVADGSLARLRPGPGEVGKAHRIDDARGRYVAFLKSTFPRDLTLEGLRIVVDCAHGAAYRTAPTVFEELGATVFAIGDRPDGRNINRGVGALHPDYAARALRTHEAHLGVALDGDADRAIFIDERGDVVDGDEVMAILATRMLRARTLKRRTLVATSMSNLGLERAIVEAGGRLVRAPVGDRYVVEEMRRGGYAMGGEQSGHLVFLEHSTTGDGVVAALKLLAVMVRERKPLSELRGAMRRYPQVLLNVAVRERKPIASLPEVQRAILRAEARLGFDGRVFVRYSGTEPKVRVMVEGARVRLVRDCAAAIAGALARACGGS
ncbi:MAG: phosphoglucosamine mutase [Myxococcota bacterium]